jgi:(p)ppGpp synthase/HD superfamily hydrolase
MRKENENVNDMGTKQLHLTASFTSAVDYARHIHIERRKGTDIPYMAHLLGVASLVMGEAGHAGFPVTEDMVIAALLHDAAEDQGGLRRLQDIEQNFGPNVARMVGRSANKPISKGFAESQLTSGSSPSPTRSITQEQFSKTIEKSGHGYGNDSSVGGQSRSGILMNS